MINVLEPAQAPLLTPAAQKILNAANDLFCERGIGAVGVELIAQTAGTTKKTIYDRFGSKDQLVAQYLADRQRRWQEYLLLRLNRSVVKTPTQQVRCVFSALREWMGDAQRGCEFLNAYAEIGHRVHPGLTVIRAEKDWMRSVFVRIADDARLGAQLHCAYEGGLVLSTAGGDPKALVSAERLCLDLIAAR